MYASTSWNKIRNYCIIVYSFASGKGHNLACSKKCPVSKEILLKSSLVINMDQIDFEYSGILIYRLKLSNRAHNGQVLYDYGIYCDRVSVFSL